MMHSTPFQLGLLHFVHLLVTVDGHIDDRERAAILGIKKEENIPDGLFYDFEEKTKTASEQQIYQDGIAHFNECSDDEKLAAFIHLYKLAEADANISNKEVRFLLYGLKVSKISFEDVILCANMSGK